MLTNQKRNKRIQIRVNEREENFINEVKERYCRVNGVKLSKTDFFKVLIEKESERLNQM